MPFSLKCPFKSRDDRRLFQAGSASALMERIDQWLFADEGESDVIVGV